MNQRDRKVRHMGGETRAASGIVLALAGLLEVFAAVADLSGSPGASPQVKADKPADRVIRVRVAGPDDRPITGARIHAGIWTKEPFKHNWDYVTDARGQAAVALPRTLSILRLWASAEGRVPLFAHWESQEIQADPNAIPGEFVFKLRKGTVIGGLVKNEDGKPIAGARVEVMLARRANQRQRLLDNTWLAEGDAARITNTQGRWTLNNVPEGEDVELRVRLSHPEYVSDYHWGVMQAAAKVTTAALRAQTAEIVMPRGIRMTGTVTDPKGKPVAGAVVVWGDAPYDMPGSQEVRTDASGVYRFPPLPPMPVAVTVIAQGWAPDLKETQITFDNPPADFRLKPGKRLRLRFVDESGKPVPDVGVRIDGWRRIKSLYNDVHPDVLETKIPDCSDKDGIYEWTWAPDDLVEYSFGKEGYQARGASLKAGGVERKIILPR